jgi:hypothetical protein
MQEQQKSHGAEARRGLSKLLKTDSYESTGARHERILIAMPARVAALVTRRNGVVFDMKCNLLFLDFIYY